MYNIYFLIFKKHDSIHRDALWKCMKQMNILAYADDIALIGKNEIEIRKLFVEMENTARKFGLQINQEKTKYMIMERKKFKEK